MAGKPEFRVVGYRGGIRVVAYCEGLLSKAMRLSVGVEVSEVGVALDAKECIFMARGQMGR